MDDVSKHSDSEHKDMNNEPYDTEGDEGDNTPADTGDSEPKTPAEQAKEAQKKSWLEKIRSGEKTFDDIPEAQNWLRKDIDPDFKGKSSDVSEDEIAKRVKQALQKEREQNELEILVEDLEQNLDSEKVAQVKEEYESLREDGIPPLKALLISRRLAGLKDSSELVAERKRKGRTLPPQGGRTRDTTVDKDKMTEIEKRLGGNLPPGFTV